MNQYQNDETQYQDIQAVEIPVKNAEIPLTQEEIIVNFPEPAPLPSQVVKQEVEYFNEPKQMTYDEIAKFIDKDATDVRIVRNPDKSITIDSKTEIVGEPFSPIKLDDDFSDMNISTPQEDNTTARVMDMMETAHSEMMGTYTKIVDNNRVTFDSDGNVLEVIPMEEENDMQRSSKTM